MMFNWKTMFVGLLLVSLIVAGLLANHYRNNAIAYKEQRDTVTHRLTLANATITDMTKRQRDVAALDVQAAAQDENIGCGQNIHQPVDFQVTTVPT